MGVMIFTSETQNNNQANGTLLWRFALHKKTVDITMEVQNTASILANNIYGAGEY